MTTTTIKFISRSESLPPCGTFVYDIVLIPNCTITNAKKRNEKLREKQFTGALL